jgi:hypothetical protein
MINDRTSESAVRKSRNFSKSIISKSRDKTMNKGSFLESLL